MPPSLSIKHILGYQPQEIYAIHKMARLYLTQGKYQEARTLFEALLAIEPANAHYYQALGLLFYQLEKPHVAWQHLNYAVELDPTCPFAHLNRAKLSLSLGHRAQAACDLRQALTLLSTQHQQLAPKIYALLRSLSTDA